MVEREIADLIVLRPPGVADREALASARQRLAQVTGDAAAIRKVAVGAVLDARSRSDSSTVNVAHWRIVEARVDQDGRAWVGLYESGHGHNDTWMVELDEVNHPCAVWRRYKRESRNLSDCGEKLR
jgi:hypothetical protein